MDIAWLAAALVVAGVFLISFAKGALGGGFAVLGIPLLSLALGPLEAGGLLAPLFVVMDMVALYYWRPSTWSKPDAIALVPAVILGIGAGYLLLGRLDERWIGILIGFITLLLTAVWFWGPRANGLRPPALWKATAAGLATGVTTMVGHAGGPPLAFYLLPRNLPKSVYAGTTSFVFTIGNLVKVVPWLMLARLNRGDFTLMLLALPAVPAGVWLGWHFHNRLSHERLYRLCYGILAVTAVKLLYDNAVRT